jgi:hypothetical protein
MSTSVNKSCAVSMAEEPGPREARLRSAERARALARDALAAGALTDEPLGVALFLVRAVASDVMLFAGVSGGVDELRSNPPDE